MCPDSRDRPASRRLSVGWGRMRAWARGHTAEGRAVGRVLGTLDATPLQFWVAVRPGAYLQLDDVVVTTRELPDERRAGDRSPAW